MKKAPMPKALPTPKRKVPGYPADWADTSKSRSFKQPTKPDTMPAIGPQNQNKPPSSPPKRNTAYD